MILLTLVLSFIRAKQEKLLHFIEIGIVDGWNTGNVIPDLAVVKDLRMNYSNSILKWQYTIFADKNGVYTFKENNGCFLYFFLKRTTLTLKYAFEELHKLKFGHLLGYSDYDLKYEIEDFSKEINFITNILRKSVPKPIGD